MAGLFFKNREHEVQSFILKFVNNNCPELKAMDEGPRLEARANLTAVVLVIPLEAVRDAASEPSVLALRGRKAVRAFVTLGARGGNVAEVVKGLSEGDLVVRQPGKLEDGQRVRAVLPAGS